jgi:hypothetical protein
VTLKYDENEKPYSIDVQGLGIAEIIDGEYTLTAHKDFNASWIQNDQTLLSTMDTIVQKRFQILKTSKVPCINEDWN